MVIAPGNLGRLGFLGLGRTATTSDKGGWWRSEIHKLDSASPSFFLDFNPQRFVINGRHSVLSTALNVSNNSAIRTYIDQSGALVTAAANTPRIDWSFGFLRLLLEGAATNFARVSGNTGAVVGVLGAGGARPNWTALSTAYAGLTFEVTATGSTKGVSWTEFRISGTNNSGAPAYPDFRPSEFPAALSGETWTYSAYASLQSGAWPNGGSTAGTINIAEYNSANSYLLSSKSSVISAWRRYSASRTFSSPSVATANGFIGLAIAAGETVDFTFRIGGLQLEKSPAPTSLIQTTGTALTRTADLCTLHASAGNMTAWAWRGYVPSLIAGQTLLGINGQATLIAAGYSDPTSVRIEGSLSDVVLPAGYGIIPGGVMFCGGFGASGRRASNNGGLAMNDAILVDRIHTSIFLGKSGGISPGQVMYVDEVVGWVLPDRPSAAGVQAQARAAA